MFRIGGWNQSLKSKPKHLKPNISKQHMRVTQAQRRSPKNLGLESKWLEVLRTSEIRSMISMISMISMASTLPGLKSFQIPRTGTKYCDLRDLKGPSYEDGFRVFLHWLLHLVVRMLDQIFLHGRLQGFLGDLLVAAGCRICGLIIRVIDSMVTVPLSSLSSLPALVMLVFCFFAVFFRIFCFPDVPGISRVNFADPLVPCKALGQLVHSWACFTTSSAFAVSVTCTPSAPSLVSAIWSTKPILSAATTMVSPMAVALNVPSGWFWTGLIWKTKSGTIEAEQREQFGKDGKGGTRRSARAGIIQQSGTSGVVIRHWLGSWALGFYLEDTFGMCFSGPGILSLT